MINGADVVYKWTQVTAHRASATHMSVCNLQQQQILQQQKVDFEQQQEQTRKLQQQQKGLQQDIAALTSQLAHLQVPTVGFKSLSLPMFCAG